MEKKRRTRRISIRLKKSAGTLSRTEIAHIEDLLAGMIATAYASEHPDFFRSFEKNHGEQQVSGPVAAAAEVTGAPPVNATGPEKKWSMEHEEDMGRRPPAAKRRTSG